MLYKVLYKSMLAFLPVLFTTCSICWTGLLTRVNSAYAWSLDKNLWELLQQVCSPKKQHQGTEETSAFLNKLKMFCHKITNGWQTLELVSIEEPSSFAPQWNAMCFHHCSNITSYSEFQHTICIKKDKKTEY